jgi:hypothetical protein
MLPRLRPTPGFDRYAQTASQTLIGAFSTWQAAICLT